MPTSARKSSRLTNPATGRASIERADVILPSLTEAAMLTGKPSDDEGCRFWAAQGKMVVLKMGRSRLPYFPGGRDDHCAGFFSPRSRSNWGGTRLVAFTVSERSLLRKGALCLLGEVGGICANFKGAGKDDVVKNSTSPSQLLRARARRVTEVTTHNNQVEVQIVRKPETEDHLAEGFIEPHGQAGRVERVVDTNHSGCCKAT